MTHHSTMFNRGTIILLFVGILLSEAREIPSPPYIQKQPPTDEVIFEISNDKPFYIECEAVGEPAPTYFWKKNGERFDSTTYGERIKQMPGRGTLAITRPQDEDEAEYQCFAQNEYGIASSNTVSMRKAELNSFKQSQQTTPFAGIEGEPFQLQCTPPHGFPKPEVHWIFLYTNGAFKTINNTRLTMDPTGNLWFSNLTKADRTDNFRYACAATSPAKHEYKYGNLVLLEVKSGPNQNPKEVEPTLQYVSNKNTIAYRGKAAEIFCIFGGTPLPTTKWKKDGEDIKYSDRIITGNYGKSLILKTVDFDDQGQYTCEVSNGIGETKSYTLRLEIQSAPFFTLEPTIQTGAEGETIEFNCQAGGVPTPKIEWIHNGKPVSEAQPNNRRQVSGNKIVISNLQKSDTGNYGCNASNSNGYVYKDVYVNVLALPPEIAEAPQYKEGVDGEPINFSCTVSGSPKPIIKWFHLGQELSGRRYKISPNGDLTIDNITFDDRGNYTCYARNKLGDASLNATLEVREHTRILDPPIDQAVTAGSTATFRCNAHTDKNLRLTIEWLKDGTSVELDGDERFQQGSDESLVISRTVESDTGMYTCRAQTNLDAREASAQLIVQDVPNPPELQSVICNLKDATITWVPTGDNRAPIQEYIIQYNTSFTPDTWETETDQVPVTAKSYNVPMSPWGNYTFRVIAVNKVGRSQPSKHSEVCTTQPEVPHKNPDNVKGEGDTPNNLVISWTKMPEIEHNAPNFMYRLYWKRDMPNQNYSEVDITDWQRDRYVIEDQPSFQQYRIKVIAHNELGDADVSPKEVIGYSGESVPEKAPENFTMLQIQTPTTALLGWHPVPLESVRGHFLGYKIRTWSDADKVNYNEIQVQGAATKALVNSFVPFTKNYAQVCVYNGKYNGPRSEILSFDTPEGVPNEMDTLEAVPLGSTGFMLNWRKPERHNGILTGYNIYYAIVDQNMKVDTRYGREPQINDPNRLRAKLGNLTAGTKYRIYISAKTAVGESKPFFIESQTKPDISSQPGEPTFKWEHIKNGVSAAVKVEWYPNEVNPGSHFFVKFKKAGEMTYRETSVEKVEDFQIIDNLETGENYQMQVVSVDGSYYTPSKEQEVYTYDSDGPTIQAKENVATAGWFIGMMLAIAFLLIILIIVCIVKRNRGGKYAVHEREQANGRHDYTDEGGFHEYSQPLDNKSYGKTSLGSDHKLGPESDTDSMAEYGDGDTEGMNEDGSFIGQYGRKKESESQGFATLV